MADKSNDNGLPESEVLAIVNHILNKNFDTEEKLTKSIVDLSETMTQVRISMGSIQSEVKSHSDIIQKMSDAIEEMRTSHAAVLTLQNQMNEHEKTGLESRKRINERIDHTNNDLGEVKKTVKTLEDRVKSVDDKGKVDLVKIGTNLFLYIFGGGGMFALLFWIFENFILKK